jgi:hypothetical protein
MVLFTAATAAGARSIDGHGVGRQAHAAPTASSAMACFDPQWPMLNLAVACFDRGLRKHPEFRIGPGEVLPSCCFRTFVPALIAVSVTAARGGRATPALLGPIPVVSGFALCELAAGSPVTAPVRSVFRSVQMRP